MAAAGAALWYGQRTFVPPISPDDPRQVALGAAVYAARCAQCHGANLEGQPNWQQRKANGRLPAPPHDATGHTWHHPDQLLFDITKLGIAKAAKLKDYDSAMPAFAGVLGDYQQQVLDILIRQRGAVVLEPEQGSGERETPETQTPSQPKAAEAPPAT